MGWSHFLKYAAYAFNDFINSNNGSNNSNQKKGDNTMPITLARICKILDDAGAAYNHVEPDSDNELPRIAIRFEKDDKLKKDIYIILAIENNMFTLGGVADFSLDKKELPDAIIFCNLWNVNNYIPAASVSDDGTIFAGWCHFIDIDVSDEYIRENMIVTFITNTYRFYCDFLNKFA